MATHSSVLAWRIPGMGESGGLPSMGLHMTEVTQQQQQQHYVLTSGYAHSHALRFSFQTSLLQTLYFYIHFLFLISFSLIFIFGCTGPSLRIWANLVAVPGLLIVVPGLLSVVASLVAEHGLQVYGLQWLQHVGPRVHSFSSCGAQAQLLWDLPRPGIEPISPALACGFFTTGPSGKSTIFK